LGLLAPLDPRASKDPSVKLERLGLRALKACKEKPDRKAHRDHRATWAQSDLKVQLELLALLAQLDHRASKV
jgi:hypothetical protein